jgi:hypothetical protein
LPSREPLALLLPRNQTNQQCRAKSHYQEPEQHRKERMIPAAKECRKQEDNAKQSPDTLASTVMFLFI